MNVLIETTPWLRGQILSDIIGSHKFWYKFNDEHRDVLFLYLSISMISVFTRTLNLLFNKCLPFSKICWSVSLYFSYLIHVFWHSLNYRRYKERLNWSVWLYISMFVQSVYIFDILRVHTKFKCGPCNSWPFGSWIPPVCKI